jgi:hypothetical protein
MKIKLTLSVSLVPGTGALVMIKVTPTVSLTRSRLSSTLYELAARHGGYFTTREAAQGA